jgi:hypothetical protein
VPDKRINTPDPRSSRNPIVSSRFTRQRRLAKPAKVSESGFGYPPPSAFSIACSASGAITAYPALFG